MRFEILLLLIVSQISFSQTEDDKMYSIAYLTTSKLYHSSMTPFQEYANLKVKGNQSSYQTYNGREMDTLKKNGTMKDIHISKFSSHNRYVILTKDNNLTYYEVLYEDEYTYSETLDFDWKLEEGTMKIKGYTCKKAKVNYGGRTWTAWYNTEIPLNAGPYKFKGLPGLIMKVTDSTNSYDFEFYDMAIREAAPIDDRYYHLKPKDKRIVLDRNTFNATKFRYEAMSLSEKMSMGSQFKGKGGQLKVVRVDGDDNVELREPRNRNRADDNNLIEINHN